MPVVAAAQSLPGPQRLADGADEADAREPLLAPGGWNFTAMGKADLTFTDNAYLTTTNRQSDSILAPTALIAAQRTGSKSIFDAQASVAYDFYTRNSSLSGVRVKALADGTAKFVDDAFAIRARLGTDLQPSSYLRAIPATERVIGGNQLQVLTYGISPSFRRPLNNDVLAEASYDFSGVSYLRASNNSSFSGASDAFFHKFTGGLSNRNASRPLIWNVEGHYEQRNFANGTVGGKRASGEARGQYELSSHFALLGRGGYDWIEETSLSGDLSGPYALAGILYKPTSRSTLRLEAGYRFGQPNYEGELRHVFGRRLTVNASVSQGVDSSQGFLNDLFARAGRDEFGNYVDLDTGLPPDPRIAQFDFSNQAFRYTRFRVGMSGTFGRNFYNASGAYERRRIGPINGNSWSGQATLGRNLTRSLSAALEARYMKTTRPDLTLAPFTSAETKTASARLNYQMTRTVAASVRYVHLQQKTTFVDYRENAAIISLTKTF